MLSDALANSHILPAFALLLRVGRPSVKEFINKVIHNLSAPNIHFSNAGERNKSEMFTDYSQGAFLSRKQPSACTS